MSGGVDSSVAAYLLKSEGYEVVALFMNNWEEKTPDGRCSAESDYEDVKAVSFKLKIPYYSVNFAREYKEFVFKHFLSEYAAGRTRNPDVLCNREIKFKYFLDFALKLGADKIATGHYCGTEEKDGRYYLLKAADASKDQTYFLNGLSQTQLKYSLFPLKDYLKTDVRAIAAREGLITAGKKDSTGICFIGERKFRDFLKGYLPANPGNIVDENGKIIGAHEGLMYYTKGQRRGLNIGGRKDETGRWFVVGKSLPKNELVVSCGEGASLYSRGLKAVDVNWIPAAPSQETFNCTIKTRYRQAEQPATAMLDGTGATVRFQKPQRAVTEGQYAVFYDGEYCLGGGVIDEVFN